MGRAPRLPLLKPAPKTTSVFIKKDTSRSFAGAGEVPLGRAAGSSRGAAAGPGRAAKGPGLPRLLPRRRSPPVRAGGSSRPRGSRGLA